MEEQYYPEPGPRWSDQRVELMLGALVCAVIGLLLALVVSIFIAGWPSFAHNGLSWFGPGGNVDEQLRINYLSGATGTKEVYTFHAWQLIAARGATITAGAGCDE